MFTPSAVIGMWFRGLMGIAVVSVTACLFALWYRELPQLAEEVRPVPNQKLDEPRPVRLPGVLQRISLWRPGLDKPTASLTAALLLSLLSLGGGRRMFPLLRHPAQDDPSSSRSERRVRLRRPDGTELNIEEFGKSDGTTVILTHGWGMDSTEWYYAKKELAKEHRVVVWDLPGVGLSTRAVNNDYSIKRFATDLHAIVEWSGATRIVMVGHSIGGMVLQTYARLFPTEPSVAGLALVHTTYTNPLRTTKHGAVYSAIEKPVIVPLLYLTVFLSPLVWLMNVLSYLNGSTHHSTEKQSFSGGESKGQLDFTARFVLAQSPAVLAKGMLGMLEFDESTNVKTIRFPTVVVAAENDPVTLPSASRFLTESIPTAYCVTIPSGRHQAQMEMNESFLGALKAFIQSAVSGQPTIRNSEPHEKEHKMLAKTDFTDGEWEALRDAPHLVAFAVATAGASGPIGTIKEAFAPVGAIIEAAKGNNPLLRSICDGAELKAAQQSLRGSIKLTDAKTLRDELQARAADKAREATAALQQKGDPGDVDAFRTLLVNIADRTAKAAKEGGFLGFGGEWVSEGERGIIIRISQAMEEPST